MGPHVLSERPPRRLSDWAKEGFSFPKGFLKQLKKDFDELHKFQEKCRRESIPTFEQMHTPMTI